MPITIPSAAAVTISDTSGNTITHAITLRMFLTLSPQPRPHVERRLEALRAMLGLEEGHLVEDLALPRGGQWRLVEYPVAHEGDPGNQHHRPPNAHVFLRSTPQQAGINRPRHPVSLD